MWPVEGGCQGRVSWDRIQAEAFPCLLDTAETSSSQNWLPFSLSKDYFFPFPTERSHCKSSLQTEAHPSKYRMTLAETFFMFKFSFTMSLKVSLSKLNSSAILLTVSCLFTN